LEEGPLMAQYVRHAVVHSRLTDRYFYVAKLKVIGDDLFQAIGKKYDVTESVRVVVDKAVEAALKKAAKKKKPTKRKVKA
jgi:hypothetical protein